MARHISDMDVEAFSGQPSNLPAALRSYRVDLPHDLLDEDGCLLDWVLDFAFESLGACHLDLRIVAETCLGMFQIGPISVYSPGQAVAQNTPGVYG